MTIRLRNRVAGEAASGKRVRLRLRSPNGVWATHVNRTREEGRPCTICCQPIPVGASCYVAHSLTSERVCEMCAANRIIERNATRCTVLTIAWDNALSGEEIRNLSRAWGLKISEDQPVAQVHTETFGTA